MKLLKWICVVLWLAAATAQAKTEEVVQQASGFGDTPAAAVANALVEASRQALGVSVLSDPSFRVATYEWVANENMA
ncbi:MAG: penicillin-binding protein activator LpoB, partial [Alcanivoracaceae bacterium]